jgi:ferric-dicitrate binding protein FerR (iron transport regulator)/TolA-binding protein
MSRSEQPDSRALTRLVELLRRAPEMPTPTELDRGLAGVRAKLSERKAPRRRRALAWGVALAVPCLVLALVAAFWMRHSAPAPERLIAVSRVEGGRLLQGGYLSESGPQGVQVFFDEGSRCALTLGGRGRLRFEQTAGVRLVLERGSASLQITPTQEPRWSVESGPFLVTVKGTDFTVGWDPTSEHFELTLRRGRVVVSGPVVGDDFVVRPGQKLSVSLPKAETIITEERPAGSVALAAPSAAPPVDSSASVAPALTEGSKASSGSAPAPSTAATTTSPQLRPWREALANGEWDRIVAEAERNGIDATLEMATPDDLFALADAARYRRRLDLAQAALLAHRRRFPSSPRAAEAIFLLGRVAELRPAGRATALARYDEYLARAPNGTYAAEALGRKMTLLNDTGGAAKARPIAEAYLRRFPDGSYAGAARALLSVGE